MSWKINKAILVLDYKKRNDRKILHSEFKVTASNSDIKSMHYDKNQKL